MLTKPFEASDSPSGSTEDIRSSGDTFPTDVEYFFDSESTDYFNALKLSVSDGQSYITSKKDDITDSSFFNDLLTSREEEQSRASTHITQLLKDSLFKTESNVLIRTHLSSIVRLATEIPFANIRKRFTDFLQAIRPELEKLKIDIPKPVRSPSKFFTENSVIPIDTNNPEAALIFQNAFLRTGRVSHITRILAWHPKYYLKHQPIYDFIMQSSLNPLNPQYSHYLAIMAAASVKCSYLVQEQENAFVHCKGEKDWLKGFSNLPAKLKNIAEVNAILAHQPWLLKKEHIEKLLKGKDAWSVPELVHAFVILASYRALAAFVWAMGITAEVDFLHRDLDSVSTPVKEEANELVANTTTILLQKLIHSNSEDDEECEAAKNVELFTAAEKINPADKKPSPQATCLASNGWSDDLESRFGDPYKHLYYVDFDTSHSIFHVEDFSWGTHGFSLVKWYYVGAANLLDECFKCIRSLTYKSFGNTEVDTGPFRKAIWYYVHRVFGIFYDDYNYQNVNTFVHQTIKSFIKNMACTPWRVTASDLSNIAIQLLPAEKAHIALLVLEARKNSELLYVLRAISNAIK